MRAKQRIRPAGFKRERICSLAAGRGEERYGMEGVCNFSEISYLRRAGRSARRALFIKAARIAPVRYLEAVWSSLPISIGRDLDFPRLASSISRISSSRYGDFSVPARPSAGFEPKDD